MRTRIDNPQTMSRNHPVPFFRGLALGLLAALVCGCRPQPPAAAPFPPFTAADATHAFDQTARLVALGPRAPGTPGGRRAAEHLERALQAAGAATARIASFEDATPSGTGTFHNVLATFPAANPQAPWIVLLSHFDTKRDVPGDTDETPFVGANDGGSSTGLLLALAARLARLSPAQPPPCNTLIAFLDGEECALAYSDRDGLHGSRRLARDLRREGLPVRAVILADMIGDRDLLLEIPRNGAPELRLLALACAERLGIRPHVTLGSSVILDDHQPFLDQGFPAVDLIDFAFGSAPGRNDYWHTVQDTMDKLDPRSFQITGSLIIALMNALCGQPGEAPQ
jgi:Zn-dependent M28 family amino/carboxypeptidase